MAALVLKCYKNTSSNEVMFSNKSTVNLLAYRSRFALVKIFFLSSDTEVVREVPAYEFMDFIGTYVNCDVFRRR
jgi:hypothetical protein